MERSGLILTEAVGKRGEAAEDNRSEVAGAIIVNIAKIVGEMIRRNVHLYSARTRPSPGRGASSWGEADLTVFTDAVEDNESDDEVTESLLGEIGDLLSPRSSLEDESLPLILLAIALTGGLELTLVVPLELSSSWELDLAMFVPN